MINYTWKQYLLSFLIIGLIIFFVNKFKGSDDEFICAKYNSFKHLEINGIVKEKLIDERDHDNLIVIYIDKKGDLKRLNLSFDATRLYESIKVSDTIFKEINSANVKVNDKMYKVDYGVRCD